MREPLKTLLAREPWGSFSSDDTIFSRVVELREEKYVTYDGKVTTDSPSREFLEVTMNINEIPFSNYRATKESKKLNESENDKP